MPVSDKISSWRCLGPVCLFLILSTRFACCRISTHHDQTGVCDDVAVTNVYVSFDVISDEFSIRDVADEHTVAHARYKNCINSTGFAYLRVLTNNSYTYKFNSSVQTYAAGLAEGWITREIIALHYENMLGDFCHQTLTPMQCDTVENFLRQNLDWIEQNVDNNPDDEYWYQVRLFYEQMRGLQDGYDGQPGRISMHIDKVFGVYLLSLIAELKDIRSSLFGLNTTLPDFGHCSVLIKVLQDQDKVKDVLIAHTTWIEYRSMLRILKRYDFYLRKRPTTSEPAIGHSMTFSSYPGALVSIDDFYVLSSAMIVTETTNLIFSEDLFKKIHPHTVLESVRVTVANRLANHGDDWSETFSRYNSGTYNNQWMVMDLKQYDEYFHEMMPGFLTVLEQIPGKVHYEDMTKDLLKLSYWASYNIPYFPDIFNASGLPKEVEKYGDFFTHHDCPRAKIFRRDQSKVNDLESMTKLMRYNDYQHDPLSRCNCTPPYSAFNAISARSDLNPPNGTYPFPLLGFALLGATDMKLTSLKIAMDNLTFMAISGPTFDPLPPFQWSKAVNGSITKHLGMPDVFQFYPVWFYNIV